MIFTSINCVEIVKDNFQLIVNGISRYDIFNEVDTVCNIDLHCHFSEEDPIGLYDFKIPVGDINESFLSCYDNKLNFSIGADEQFAIENNSKLTKEYIIFQVARLTTDEKTVVISYSVMLSSGQIVSPGKYQGKVDAQIYFDGKLMKEVPIKLSIDVDQQGEVMISDFSFTEFVKTKFALLDFGTLEGDTRRDASIAVRSNYQCSIKLESRNGGVLTLRSNSTYDDEVKNIPYVMSIDGENISLDVGQITLPFGKYRGDLFGISKNISINVYPNFRKNLAGSYKDQILISIVSI